MVLNFLNSFMGFFFYSEGLKFVKFFEVKMKFVDGRLFFVWLDYYYVVFDIMVYYVFGGNILDLVMDF